MAVHFFPYDGMGAGGRKKRLPKPEDVFATLEVVYTIFYSSIFEALATEVTFLGTEYTCAEQLPILVHPGGALALLWHKPFGSCGLPQTGMAHG